ncbi:uncharacterized protein BP01DRAFT_392583 [Aspergillus saccharolyticus JOP 1030-1]|uniref:Glycine zipper 2TM domain-containing protein n=1 Tax=Aspergillus saccharolyticus JOP 1030-1 TaxID=1450539 RepID=A0A318ZCQ5_9EURO|nr:hypothetical protein BP01DRAFT_392583 [Aspergillus saccharolyticus JOP 1030-1]PYH44337.1 hypothetical protein BP01DRAFT_392583 [Aspergillus saccharolyticus JOP 1030-1]
MTDPYFAPQQQPPPVYNNYYEPAYDQQHHPPLPPTPSSPFYPSYVHPSPYNDVSQIPRSHAREISPMNQEYSQPVPPPQTENHYDPDRLGAQYIPPRQGSSAEYYDQSRSFPMGNEDSVTGHDVREGASYPSAEAEADHDAAAGAPGTERGLAGALLGGTTGYYLGHKRSHGFLGAVGGALLGSFMEDRLKKDSGGGGGGGGMGVEVDMGGVGMMVLGGVATVIAIAIIVMGMGMDIITTTIIIIGTIGIGIIQVGGWGISLGNNF